jgi:hypothetical protein
VNKNHDFAPDFFVVGAPKGGTTAVFHWLKGHPEVFLPDVKEPGYFAYANRSAVPRSGPYDLNYHAQITVDGKDYAKLYEGAEDRLTGDISPVYLVDKTVAARIASIRPDARIIVMLRDPVQRAFSQFLHHVRDGLEPFAAFEAALEQEAARLEAGWSWGHGYATHGHYASQIDSYLDAFHRDQILFLEFAQLNAEPDACWRQICDHLGIQQMPLEYNERVNVTSNLATVPSRPAITHAIRHPGRIQQQLKRLIPKNARKWLRKVFEGDGKPLPRLQHTTRRALAIRYQTERTSIEAQTGLSLDHWTRAD